MDIFFSVGSHSTDAQERFTTAVDNLLVHEGMRPRTPGRTEEWNTQPLRAIAKCMQSCSGAVVVAFERIHLVEAVERRGGSGAREIRGQNLPTVWNQIEGAMAYVKDLPLLVLAEKGLRADALLESKYDWNIQWIDLDPAVLSAPQFRGVFADWKLQVEERAKRAPAPAGRPADPASQTVGQLVGSVKPAQLWGLATIVVSLAATGLGAAYKLGRDSVSPPPITAAVDAGPVLAPVWMNDSIPLLTLRDQVSVSVREISDTADIATVSIRMPGGEQVFQRMKPGEQRSFIFGGEQYLVHLLDVTGGDQTAGAARIKIVRGN
jgi:hypothetical protein